MHFRTLYCARLYYGTCDVRYKTTCYVSATWCGVFTFILVIHKLALFINIADQQVSFMHAVVESLPSGVSTNDSAATSNNTR